VNIFKFNNSVPNPDELANKSSTGGDASPAWDPLAGYFPLIHKVDPNEKQLVQAPGDGRPLSVFARELGKLLHEENFFAHEGKCCRIQADPRMSTHRIKEIDPHQFRSVIEKFCWIVTIKILEQGGRKDSFQTKRSISVDVARATLASDDLLSSLRSLESLNTVRLPVCRKTGTIELLPKGYDSESQIFTISSEEYFETGWKLETARKYLRELLSEFCFKPDDCERSISVVLACMLSLFCRHILDANIIRPAFIFTANAPGSGKTLAAKLGIIPVLGYCPVGSAPKDETERQKLIFATALSNSPILFLDNVSGYLKSPSLEALVTSRSVKDRVLGESRIREVANNLTVIITGNDLSISADLQRRSLLVELFLEQARSEDRAIKNPLDDAKIAEVRPKILSALWALVQSWEESGRPKPKTTHQAFLAWSEIIGGMVENAGFSSPCSTPVLKNSGDPDFRDMLKLVETINPGREFRFSELVDFAADYNLFENLIPAEEDERAIAAAKRKKLSQLWKGYNERVFPQGQRFRIVGETQKTRRYLIE
jgi:hypothetical protein